MQRPQLSGSSEMLTAAQNVRLPPRLSVGRPSQACAAATAPPFAAGLRAGQQAGSSSASARRAYGSQRGSPGSCDISQEWRSGVCRLCEHRAQAYRHRQRRHPRAAPSASAAAAAATAANTAAHSAQLLAARICAYGAQIGAYLPFLPAAVHALQSVQLPPLPTAALAGA